MQSGSISALAGNFITAIINPALALLFTAGLLVFVFGLVEFLIGMNSGATGSTQKNTGKQHMLWGIIGVFIMSSAWAIITLIASMICNGSLSACAQ